MRTRCRCPVCRRSRSENVRSPSMALKCLLQRLTSGAEPRAVRRVCSLVILQNYAQQLAAILAQLHIERCSLALDAVCSRCWSAGRRDGLLPRAVGALDIGWRSCLCSGLLCAHTVRRFVRLMLCVGDQFHVPACFSLFSIGFLALIPACAVSAVPGRRCVPAYSSLL